MKTFKHSQVTVGSTIFAKFSSARINDNWTPILDALTITFITPTGRINAEGIRGKFVFAPNTYNQHIDAFGKTRNTYSSVYIADNDEDAAKAAADKATWEAEVKVAKAAADAEKAKRMDDRMAKISAEKAAAKAANPNPVAASIFGTPFWTVKVTNYEGYERDVVFTMTPSVVTDWKYDSPEAIKKAAVQVEGWMAAHSTRPRSSYNFSLSEDLITEGKSPSQVVFDTVNAIIDRVYGSSI